MPEDGGQGPDGAKGEGDETPELDRDHLLSSRGRARSPHLLFMLESWSDLGDDILGFLASTKAFSGASRHQLRDLLPYLEPVHVAAGDIVIRQGAADVSDGLYIVGYGRLRIHQEEDGRRYFLGEVGPGDTIGEWELITGTPRRASVQAVRDSLLMRLSRSGLDRLAQWHPDLPFRLARQLLHRLVAVPGAGPDKVAPGVMTLAVVPAGRSALPERFLDQLADALERSGTALVVSSRTIDRALGEDASDTPLADARNGRIVDWLQSTERAHRLVVYEADPTPSNWTRRCLRQADRVVLVARAGDHPGLGAVEEDLLGRDLPATEARRELVLLHDHGAGEPVATAAWLSRRHVAAHHHVRDRDPSHFQRLARLLTGRGVGVVFGGGGARGSAHLGVVRALEGAGIPIDAVGGTSIGSIVAFMCAMGWDHRQRMQKLPSFFSTRLIIQPTVPFVSLSSGRRLQRLIADETGGRAIEDLWIRFFSVSTNLSRATQVVHDRGELSVGLRASVSLPGVLPPVPSGTDLLVDGGLLNNLPIDVMTEQLGGGRVIAVDLRRQVELKMQAAAGPSLSGWLVLARRAWPRRERFDPPSIGAILQRSVELAGLLNDRTLLGRPGLDLYLRPPVSRLATLDFKAAPLLVDDAYRYTREQLANLAVDELFDAQPAGAPDDLAGTRSTT